MVGEPALRQPRGGNDDIYVLSVARDVLLLIQHYRLVRQEPPRQSLTGQTACTGPKTSIPNRPIHRGTAIRRSAGGDVCLPAHARQFTRGS